MLEIINNYPQIVLAEPNYEKSVIIQDFFKSRNVARVIETLRDGIETLDFIKSMKVYNFKLKGILINLELPYVNEVLNSINKTEHLKDIPIIIFSDKEKNFINTKYGINDKSHILKPMQLIKCEEIIKSSDNNSLRAPVFCGRKKSSYLL